MLHQCKQGKMVALQMYSNTSGPRAPLAFLWPMANSQLVNDF